MMRWHKLTHQFVQHLPERLEPGVLYVSLEFATASHLCCCGCGEEVVTPLSPAKWKMTFDGESVSLWPSIGSWDLPCRSHYVIGHGQVREAEAWTDAEVVAGRRRDRAAAARYYEETHPPAPPPAGPPARPVPTPTGTPSPVAVPGWWARLRGWLFGRRQ